MIYTDAEMNHGHVRYQNGIVARCGGPAMCKVCRQEFDTHGLVEFVKLQNRVRRAEAKLETLLKMTRFLQPAVLYELAGEAMAILRS